MAFGKRCLYLKIINNQKLSLSKKIKKEVKKQVLLEFGLFVRVFLFFFFF